MSDERTNDNFIISEVIGSLRFGSWNKKSILLHVLLASVGVFWLLLDGILFPILYVDEMLTLLQMIVLLVILACMGLFCMIYSGISLIKMIKGRALLRRCIQDGDLHRSRADVIVTTESNHIGLGRTPAIITLRFKVNGKKYEKKNLKNISYATKYYNIDILYAGTHDEVFLLKMD